MKCKNNPRHKMRYIESDHECACEYCDYSYESYWVCDACKRKEKREYEAKLKAECNRVVEITSDMVIKRGKIQEVSSNIKYYFLPHGGKKFRKGTKVIMGNDGYLKKVLYSTNINSNSNFVKIFLVI